MQAAGGYANHPVSRLPIGGSVVDEASFSRCVPGVQAGTSQCRVLRVRFLAVQRASANITLTAVFCILVMLENTLNENHFYSLSFHEIILNFIVTIKVLMMCFPRVEV